MKENSGSRLKTIYVVFKTHFDIGFTDLASKVIERYGRKMLPDVITTCHDTQTFDRGHRFVWTMSSWPLLQSILPSNASPDDIEAAKELLREGQLAWHLLPYTTLTEFCGLEEYIRGFRFSRDLSAQYGFWPISAKMTDAPEHTWILPTLLCKAGVKLLHIGCNPGCMPPDVPRLFFWEGPDGSRVLVFYSKENYGSSVLPPEDWDFPVWLALRQTNDNSGPQGPEVIEQILETVRREQPGTDVVVGTMDDFYRALETYPTDGIPVVRSDLADTWIHGVSTFPREAALLRSLRPAAAEAEKALSVGEMFGCIGAEDGKSLRADFDRFYERSLLFGEHTWGLDVKTTLRRYRYKKSEFLAVKQDAEVLRIEQSWDEQRELALEARRLLDGAQPRIMDALAANLAISGRRMIAFNGLGWERGAWVDADALRPGDGEAIVDAATGEALAAASEGGRALVYVPGLPAFGWRALAVRKAAAPTLPPVFADAEAEVLENKWFRLRADAATGSILSFAEKESGREWVDAGAGFGLGQYRYDLYGSEDVNEYLRAYVKRFSDWIIADQGKLHYPEIAHRTWYAGGFSIAAEADARSASLVMRTQITGPSVEEYGNAGSVETRVTLYANEPYADLTVRLFDKRETPYVEAGHIVMPFDIKNHTVRINKTGSVIDPETDIVRDANHSLYCCENWVDLSDGGAGVAIVPFDTPLFSLGEPAIYRYVREPVRMPPTLYLNLYNNSWGTNFPQWMGGDYCFRFRIFPHRGEWREGRVQQRALESVTPVPTGVFEGDAGTLPLVRSMLTLPEGVTALALKAAYDGDGHVLRLRELEGREHTADTESALPGFCAQQCDLLERTNDGGGAPDALRMGPFDIQSMRIQLWK